MPSMVLNINLSKLKEDLKGILDFWKLDHYYLDNFYH